MLIEEIVDFCDKKFNTYGDKCGCQTCNHPAQKCSGSCYDCLYQIHFPSRFENPKKTLYDCPKMVYHYICQFTYKYTSEILYAFNLYADYLKDFKEYNIMSIGCGGCPDLMALEKLCNDNYINTSISYMGYDINPLWKPIHSKIERYCDSNNIKRMFMCVDAFNHFKKYFVKDTNIIIISYLISYLYNTNQILQIDNFFNYLVDNVILRKDDGEKLLIIINDVNSNLRGRDFFNHLQKIIKLKNHQVISEYKYFDTGNLNFYQKIGTPYDSTECLFKIDSRIKSDYHIKDDNCGSIQLIIKVN